ncbi:MAG TPA: adenylate/guanylate cyclase domain-containing protein, partial [Gammaproteobacteria bacterium]|nr:adenylate/guanylate cyclase domain-containing protein [Gammaproteobacteria bacterium]
MGTVRAAVRRGIERVDNLAVRNGDAPDERLLKSLLLFLGVFALLLGGSGAAYLAMLGRRPAALTAAAVTAVVAAAFAHFLIRKDRRLLQAVLVALLLVLPTAFQFLSGGSVTADTGLWTILAPLMALLFYGARASIPWFAVCLALLFAAGLSEGEASLVATESRLLFASLVYILLRHFVAERERMRAALAQEHELLLREQDKSEQLLLNILPAPIAQRLKQDPGAIADSFADVSVVFADIVGFTQLSSHTPPAEIVRLLNDLFSRFDELSGRLGVEKIKTIGDAYMACAGLPVERADHAAVAAELALGMREALAVFCREQKVQVDIRIGINSGPVVAGVIGLRKFIYDLWGDTVNTASRMESHG